MALLVVLLLLALGIELAGRAVLASRISAAVHSREPNARDIATSVSFPLLPGLILHGRLARVRVSASQVDLGPLVAERVAATATGVQVDVASSLSRQQVVITGIDHIDFNAAFTPAQASKPLPPGTSFQFGPGTVSLVAPGGLTLKGAFEVRPGGKVGFTVPGVAQLPSLSFLGYPFGTCITGVTVTVAEATITCSLDHPGTDLFMHR